MINNFQPDDFQQFLCLSGGVGRFGIGWDSVVGFLMVDFASLSELNSNERWVKCSDIMQVDALFTE